MHRCPCLPPVNAFCYILNHNSPCLLYCACYAGCGGKFNDHSGIITSPGYPDDYGDDENCAYLITSPTGGLLALETLDFHLEDCCDFVEVSNDSNPIQYTIK